MEAGSEEGDGLQMLKGQKKVMVPQMLKGQKKVMKNQKRKVREEMRREKVKTEMRDHHSLLVLHTILHQRGTSINK